MPPRRWAADFKVGDTVSVEGRLGVVFWDGRPKHEYAMLRWKDDGSESGVKASEIQTGPLPSVSLGLNGQAPEVLGRPVEVRAALGRPPLGGRLRSESPATRFNPGALSQSETLGPF
uniref:Uncharacterized protein n=1 Tax=Alexandrium andersonii TaxID=327968 RepID=A0A7S2MB06_9DINO